MALVVVAEDDSGTRKLVSVALSNQGHEVLAAGDGMSAWALVREHGPEVIVSDVNMPGMTGSEFVTAIRATDRVMPIVMVTAEADRERIMELQAIGVNGYLLKPFKQQALLTVLAKIFPEKP